MSGKTSAQTSIVCPSFNFEGKYEINWDESRYRWSSGLLYAPPKPFSADPDFKYLEIVVDRTHPSGECMIHVNFNVAYPRYKYGNQNRLETSPINAYLPLPNPIVGEKNCLIAGVEDKKRYDNGAYGGYRSIANYCIQQNGFEGKWTQSTSPRAAAPGYEMKLSFDGDRLGNRTKMCNEDSSFADCDWGGYTIAVYPGKK